MSLFKYEGAIDTVSERQLKFIGDVLEKRGFRENTRVWIENVGVPGDNYFANVKRIIVEEADGKSFKMIAKIAPSHEITRSTSNTQNLFVNESIMYTEVLAKFRQLQTAAEVPQEDMLRCAECYGCLLETPYEMILLEDLMESGFEMLDRFKSLSDDCVKAVMKNLAIFHSLSFVLKHKEPQKFIDYKNRLFDTWTNIAPERAPFFDQLNERVLKILSDDDYRQTVFKRATLKQFSTSIFKLSKTDAGTKHAVIQQGDQWTNNIMFKFDEETLLGAIMIDYQLSREANPAFDLMYTIFNCTNHELRRKHFHEWIDHYHIELDKSLTNHGLKANYVYPKDQLDVDLKRYGKVMFCLVVMITSVLTLKSEEAAKLKEAMETADIQNNNVPEAILGAKENILRFKNKIEGLVDSFAEFGLL